MKNIILIQKNFYKYNKKRTRTKPVQGIAELIKKHTSVNLSQRKRHTTAQNHFIQGEKKLVDMITEITKAQLLNWKLGLMMDDGDATFEQISMAKRNNVSVAYNVARNARQILGGMGITAEYPVMRHLINLETLITYQGTDEIHTLITGRNITGVSAF